MKVAGLISAALIDHRTISNRAILRVSMHKIRATLVRIVWRNG